MIDSKIAPELKSHADLQLNIAFAVLGIDLGKNSCSVAALDGTGRIIRRRRLTRDGVVPFAADLPSCVMAMDACCGAHHLGRVPREHGRCIEGSSLPM